MGAESAKRDYESSNIVSLVLPGTQSRKEMLQWKVGGFQFSTDVGGRRQSNKTDLKTTS